MATKETLKIKISGYEGFATRIEKTLPFWVSTIGTASFQPPVHRPLGIDDHQLLYTLSGCGEALLNGKALSLKKRHGLLSSARHAARISRRKRHLENALYHLRRLRNAQLFRRGLFGRGGPFGGI